MAHGQDGGRQPALTLCSWVLADLWGKCHYFQSKASPASLL